MVIMYAPVIYATTDFLLKTALLHYEKNITAQYLKIIGHILARIFILSSMHYIMVIPEW